MNHKIAFTFACAASAVSLLAGPVTLTGKAVTPAADGAVTIAPNQYASAAPLISVDPAKSYTISAEFRSNGKPNEAPSGVLFGVIPFDAKYRQIAHSMVCAIAGTETELAAPVKKGAKSLIVKDASKWKTAASCYAIAFDVLPDYADLPNRKLAMLITKITKAANGWQIDFSIPVDRDYAAGVKVRQHQEGGYCWCGFADKIFKGNEWTAMGNTVTGEAKFGVPRDKFWKGTRFVRIVVFRSKGAALEVRNISFDEEK